MRTTKLASNTMRKIEDGKVIYFGRGLLPPHSDLNTQEIADQGNLMVYQCKNDDVNDVKISLLQLVLSRKEGSNMVHTIS